MKILYVIANLSLTNGGPSKACVEMARSLAKRGHDVDIFTTNQDGPKGRLDVPTDRPVRQDGVNIYYFHAEVLRGWPCVSFGLWHACRDKLQEYDIVHNHSLYLFHDLVVGHYCRKYSIPYLIRPCGALDPYIFKRHRLRKGLLELLFEKRNFRHAAAIHFTAQEEMDLARPMIPFKQGLVVPLGLHLDEYTKDTPPGLFRDTFPETGDRKIILFLSRINFKKGLDLLIPAFARIARKRNDIHLVIAGPDNDGFGKQVAQWVEDEKVVERTTFTGMLQGELKLAALRESEIFALPSYSENFGIAVVEAMASGLPVLISNKVNIWGDIEAASAGLVGTCDISSIEGHLEELLADPERARTMGRNGERLVQERYNWPKTAAMLEAAYLRLQSTDSKYNNLEKVSTQ